MSGIKRYVVDRENGDIYESEHGQYVKFADHKSEIGRKVFSDKEWISHPQTVEAHAQWAAVAESLGADPDCPDSVLAAARSYFRLRAEADSLRKTLGEVTQCLADTVNDVGGWAVEEVIESGMSAAMGDKA